jgi:hypothetical protein
MLRLMHMGTSTARVTRFALAALLGLGAVGCGGQETGPRASEAPEGDALKVVVAYSQPSTNDLSLGIDACQAEARVDAVEETATSVTVRVLGVRQLGEGPACMDVLVVTLAGALGDREVIDAFDGQRVPRETPR